MSKPITLDEAKKRKQGKIPSVVIDAFNKLITANLNGNSARILQKDVIREICKNSDFDSRYIYDHDYLDVEPIFEKAGWKVDYDKPGYCESYDAYFVFTKKF